MTVLVAQSCLTLCDPLNCSPPGSSVHESLQEGILEWIAIPFSRGIILPQGMNPGLMVTHSSTLAWKIPWMEEPGRLQSMGSLRVRHD